MNSERNVSVGWIFATLFFLAVSMATAHCWRQARDENTALRATVAEEQKSSYVRWVSGHDNRFGTFTLVTLDNGRNYYAADIQHEDGAVFIRGDADKLYPGLVPQIKEEQAWQAIALKRVAPM